MPNLLKVWSFDKSLTNEDKEELLKHFGAVNVRHVSCRGQNAAVLASFKNEEDCKYALQKLHQLEVLGSRIMAIYKDSSLPPCSDQPHRSKEETKIHVPSRQERIRQKICDFESQLSALGPNIGVSHPIPPNLRYLYPPPSPSVIANIAQTLVAVPKFYTQVLHLMNKMNLPTPFEPVTKIPTVYTKLLNLMGYEHSMEKNICSKENDKNAIKEGLNSDTDNEMEDKENDKSDEQDTSEAESELESEGDGSVSKQQKIYLPVRRKLRSKNVFNKKPKLSLLKHTCVSHPRNSESVSVKDVFEASESHGPKKLQLRLEGTVLPQAEVEAEKNVSLSGGFGMMTSSVNVREVADDMVEWRKESSKYISKEELQANVVNKADWPLLTVFKNYHPGEPSTKLYIKNLAKTTSEENLKYIYGRYVFWQNEEEVSEFSIRLMKEGRMKGQAFVTFPSVKQAIEALEDTNGFILNDKPMVVVYGKVKTAQVTN
ncbi:RNA-binding region-containing protein 3 isoform X1 [Procambarus clarkii]|uniref:RNA-binding region-containing protein 3 isoform X1 n=1 Tax=Procambarus clarkii TaxID=6728 RepID=UPI001E674E66|nr:RNA-binding region-containing protein 3-like isoform X1 [Procambarus clarkii]XP_045616101.1 RNA-binding region-containing protein 3-like isoform X1 [Procambarus clarkii]XP_045616103.1 RNA-binding region-containing protein 3-like isoform X1 [Procambarus clarkii]XP_045616104.1 RNA-binding region-containing protein 3-like isoform X1 [Procambarus clarkii]XP_045616105.1 RNA-binding region-containing protein 3-like isoform X1 [Procambarus clarkii]XP_045616106.1 RNA-binding region-containing prote